MLILINNKFVLEKDASVPISQSLFCGYGIFETIRTYKNKKFFMIEDHLERLFSSANEIGLEMKYDKDEIMVMLNRIVEKSLFEEQRIKIVAMPGELIITSRELETDPKIYSGVKCLSVKCRRSLPEIKSTSYLPSFLSHKKAEDDGCFEAVLIDENGDVYEGAYSNIFWFEDDVLCTRRDKVLPGITRKAILEFSSFDIKLKTINISELCKLKEVFITSSIKGIVSVIQIDDKIIGNGTPGVNTKKLSLEFLSCVNVNLDK